MVELLAQLGHMNAFPEVLHEFVQHARIDADGLCMSDQATKALPAVIPRPPAKIAELNIPTAMVEDLFIRRLHLERTSNIHDVSTALGIRMSIGRELAEDLRTRQILEYHGMEGRDYRIGLTQQGTNVALSRMTQSTYAGVAPVSLADYTERIWDQKTEMLINRETIRSAFGDMVLEDDLLDQLGPAFLADGAIFLYGPPGTGKTSLAERMIRIYDDRVLVPRAVAVDGQIISVYDGAVHTAAPEQPADLDPRWVLCDRPIVLVGGELTMKMLELDFDPISGTYTAPIQMKANNGILVIDDFGRQQVSPGELLNRWIVPLSRDIDFLKLASGTKFTVPFELKFVASTNLDPSDLGDDAFLRRLRNKVYVGPITANAFNWILVRVAQASGIEVTAESAEYLQSIAIEHIGELRPYIAIDFLELMAGIATYENRARKLDRYMIDRVARVYFFVKDGPSEGFSHTINTDPLDSRNAVQTDGSVHQPVRSPDMVPPAMPAAQGVEDLIELGAMPAD